MKKTENYFFEMIDNINKLLVRLTKKENKCKLSISTMKEMIPPHNIRGIIREDCK